MLILPNKDTAFLQNNIFSIFYQKKYAFEHKTQKTGCKTYFFICFETKFSFSLQALTKQHNLFYTLKKLIPIYNAGLCEKSRVVFLLIEIINHSLQLYFRFLSSLRSLGMTYYIQEEAIPPDYLFHKHLLF